MILISPAKKLNLKPIEVNLTFSEPVFIEKAKYLIKRLKNLNKVEVKNLLNVSDKLTLENFNNHAFGQFKDDICGVIKFSNKLSESKSGREIKELYLRKDFQNQGLGIEHINNSRHVQSN